MRISGECHVPAVHVGSREALAADRLVGTVLTAWLRCSLQAGQPAFELLIQQAVAVILGSAEISMDHQTSEVMSGLLAGI